MQYLIILFGTLIVIAGVVMLIRPTAFIDYIRRHSTTTSMRLLAIVVRIILGITLILYADNSKFPLVLSIVGWLSLAAGLIIAIIPHARFQRLINWVLDRFTGYIWAGATAALLFGLFIVYAVL